MECLDRAFENVCELDLVFHFDEVSPLVSPIAIVHFILFKVHHILSEIIEGGLVLETNVEDIDSAGKWFTGTGFPLKMLNQSCSSKSSETEKGVIQLSQSFGFGHGWSWSAKW